MYKFKHKDMVLKNVVLQMLLIMFPKATTAAVTLNNAVNDSLKTLSLDEVVVKSRYRYAKRKGDKLVVSFKGSSFYEGKTLAESLGICPLISRQGDSFQILGKESTVIYINGRPSTVIGEDLIAFLDTKSIGEVERVEIIAMPSGKFSSANKAGVINIVMSKSYQMGTMGMINAGAVKGHYLGGKANGMFALCIKNVNINAFVNYTNQKKARISESQYDFSDKEHICEISEFNQHGRPLSAIGSVEWRKGNNLIGCSYTYSSLLLDADYNNSATNALTWIKNSNTNNHYNTLQMYSDWKIAGNTISLLYSWYDRRNKTDDTYTASEMSRHFDYAKHQINNIKLDVTSTLFDSWEIGYGLSANYLQMASDFAYGDWNNSAKYKENVWKSYISTSKEFGCWTIDAGISVEHTKQNFADNHRSYNSWLPNMNVTYKNNWGLFYCQFSKTMERVPYSSLTRSPIFFSPQSMTIGNPELKPEEDHHVNLGVSKGNLNVEMFYKKYKNAYMQYSYTDDGRIVNGYVNLDDENQYGMNVSYSQAISTILLGKINLSSYFNHSNTPEIGTNNCWNNYINTSLSFRLDKKKRFDADINYWHLFPQKEHGIKWKNRSSFDISFNYNVIPSILRLTLNVNDLFNQNFAYYSRMYKDVNVINKNIFDNRKIILTARYTLSNKKRVGRNQQKSIDDLGRIPTE